MALRIVALGAGGVGSFFGGLMAWIKDKLLGEGMISPPDLDLMQVTDDPNEVVEIFRKAGRRRDAEKASEGAETDIRA